MIQKAARDPSHAPLFFIYLLHYSGSRILFGCTHNSGMDASKKTRNNL